MAGKLLSVTELAIHFGVSVTTVYDWLEKKCPFRETEEGKKVFDPVAVKEWHEQKIMAKYRLSEREAK